MSLTTAVLVSFVVGYVLLWAPLLWIGCAFFSWFLASEKQYSGILWFLLGILFGPAALVATAGLPDRAAPSRAVPSYLKLEPALRE